MKDDVYERLIQTTDVNERRWIITEAYIRELSKDITDIIIVAAIPHWFDKSILTWMVDYELYEDKENISLDPDQRVEKSDEWMERVYHTIKKQPFTEPYGNLGYALHDMTRISIIQHLIREEPELLYIYSARACDYFSNSTDPQILVEKSYHLLIKDKEQGFKEFERQIVLYSESFNSSALNNLLRNLEELTDLDLFTDAEIKTKVWGYIERLMKQLAFTLKNETGDD